MANESKEFNYEPENITTPQIQVWFFRSYSAFYMVITMDQFATKLKQVHQCVSVLNRKTHDI